MTTIYHNDNSISMTTHLPPPATILHTILHTILQSTGRHPHHLLPPATINRQPSSSSWHLSSPSDYTSHVAITPRRGILLLSWESICSSDYTMRHCSKAEEIRACQDTILLTWNSARATTCTYRPSCSRGKVRALQPAHTDHHLAHVNKRQFFF